jgi:sulfhydrogenase subunit beta (sulfur reductase)
VEPVLIAEKRIAAWIEALLAAGRVVAPVRSDAQRDGAVRWGVVKAANEVCLGYSNMPEAPKAFFFPAAERLLAYRRARGNYNAVAETRPDVAPTVLLGVRPCDARALLLLDAVFLGGPYDDPYYRARREATLVVSLACARPRATCFCQALGSGPADRAGADVLLRPSGGDYVAEAVTPRGETWLAAFGFPPAGEAALCLAVEGEAAALARLRPGPPIEALADGLPGLYGDAVWERIAEKCLGCGACTYACPTCHCFTIEDRALTGGGERLRAWDSCQYGGFTAQASGHNPRPSGAARWRQRAMHKFDYLPRNVGRYGCVGCGRCILACPVGMDIRAVVRALADAAASAAAADEETTP